VGDDVVEVLARKGQPPSRAGTMIIASRVACLARSLGYYFFLSSSPPIIIASPRGFVGGAR
jgi:hypothetical protein